MKAYDEVSSFVDALRKRNINVCLFEDDGSRNTPDSVLPNNWITTHQNGVIGLHAMYAENRRLEKREDVLTYLKDHFDVEGIIDDSGYAEKGKFLEGTGVLILDRINRIVYMTPSRRTNDELFHKFCQDFDYRPVIFHATGEDGMPVYHTNVVMCAGTDFVLVGLDTVRNRQERNNLVQEIENTGKKIIALSHDQIANFAGNALELSGSHKKYLALSTTAYTALTEEQKSSLNWYIDFISLDIPTIELAGGSTRCMLAEIFLMKKSV